MYSAETILKNKSGLHARPAAQFVAKAAEFKSEITIRNIKTGREGDAKSIIMVMSLAVSIGTEIEIEANGIDEIDAVNDLISLIDSGFGELE